MLQSKCNSSAGNELLGSSPVARPYTSVYHPAAYGTTSTARATGATRRSAARAPFDTKESAAAVNGPEQRYRGCERP
jgi:hypothetical protein